MHQFMTTVMDRAGGPLKPDFGLSGAVLQLDRVFLPLFRVFVSSVQLDLQCLSQPADITTAGPSTPQIIALAMICSGRDDRVGEI
jgi:hypothetical protein